MAIGKICNIFFNKLFGVIEIFLYLCSRIQNPPRGREHKENAIRERHEFKANST